MNFFVVVLEIVVHFLKNNKNKNNEFAYEMFEYFLLIGADVKKRDLFGNDIYFHIYKIKYETVQNYLYKSINKYY